MKIEEGVQLTYGIFGCWEYIEKWIGVELQITERKAPNDDLVDEYIGQIRVHANGELLFEGPSQETYIYVSGAQFMKEFYSELLRIFASQPEVGFKEIVNKLKERMEM